MKDKRSLKEKTKSQKIKTTFENELELKSLSPSFLSGKPLMTSPKKSLKETNSEILMVYQHSILVIRVRPVGWN